MDALEKDLLAQVEKYKKLFLISEKLHSCINVDDLYGELFIILRENYPDYSYFLLLSHDTHSHNDHPIMELEYDGDNINAARAYASGEIQYEHSITNKHAIIYVPLKGIQGVYGVLQVIVPNTLEFPKSEVEFISLLAGSVGHALENAQLYQQSQQLVSNLKLLNEASKRLNSSLRFDETIVYVAELIMDSFHAEEAGFFLLSEDQAKVRILPGSTPYFYSKQARTYIEYIKEKVLREKDSLYFADISLQKINSLKDFRSIMAVPAFHSGVLKGFAIVMHQEPYFFSFETFKLLQSLIQNSTLALINIMLREELKKSVITDHLTKLYSRGLLDEKIPQSMKMDEQGTFILIDIDNFKEINDTYGHQVGDEILVQVADLIKKSIRENDIGARWGGEELAIYLPKVSLEDGAAIAKRLIHKVAESSKPKVTVSCGVSYWHKDLSDTYNSLFKRADEALYSAKSSGKNKVVTQSGNSKVS